MTGGNPTHIRGLQDLCPVTLTLSIGDFGKIDWHFYRRTGRSQTAGKISMFGAFTAVPSNMENR